MAVISGGTVSAPGVQSVGNRNPEYYTNGVPTDATVSSAFTPANGAVAVNVLTGFIYERQAGSWVRIDTI
jgi:hypothetical protein